MSHGLSAGIERGSVPIHQLKPRDASLSVACILVKKDSPLIGHLKVDQVVIVMFRSVEDATPSGHDKTPVKHITTSGAGRSKGHHFVGIQILERIAVSS